MEKNFGRFCPQCGKEVWHVSAYYRDIAKKQKRLCIACSQKNVQKRIKIELGDEKYRLKQLHMQSGNTPESHSIAAIKQWEKVPKEKKSEIFREKISIRWERWRSQNSKKF